MDDFISKAADILECDVAGADFAFRDAPDWNSMKGFALLVMIEQDYGKRATIEEFMNCRTVRDLAVLAGAAE